MMNAVTAAQAINWVDISLPVCTLLLLHPHCSMKVDTGFMTRTSLYLLQHILKYIVNTINVQGYLKLQTVAVVLVVVALWPGCEAAKGGAKSIMRSNYPPVPRVG